MAVRSQGTRLTAEQFFRVTPSDGKRYELIDGELHEMTTPNIRHQTIARDLFRLLDPEVTSMGGEVFSPGVALILDGSTVLVPDLVVLTRRFELPRLDYGIQNPPDIVIEILSPSTAQYDRTVKSDRYAAFGVGEFWLVSPEAEIVEIFALVEGRYVLHARAGLNEPIASITLPNLTFPASAIFAQ